MRSKLYFILITIAFAAAVSGCRQVDGRCSQRRLMVSIEPQRYLLERVAGPKWSVSSLLARGEDPESFDPSISDLTNLHEAQAYFKVGTLEFENQIIDQAGGSVKCCNTSQSVDPLEGTHEECHLHHHSPADAEAHHHPTDPHTWASVRNLKVMAADMLKAMIELDPADSLTYKNNYRRLAAHLDSCDTAIAERLAPCQGRVFMMWHPSLSYFARDYRLVQLSVGMENKELSVSDFRNKIDAARRRGASVFFVQPDFDAGRSAAVATQAGVGSEQINTLAYDLPAELMRVAQIISKQ